MATRTAHGCRAARGFPGDFRTCQAGRPTRSPPPAGHQGPVPPDVMLRAEHLLRGRQMSPERTHEFPGTKLPLVQRLRHHEEKREVTHRAPVFGSRSPFSPQVSAGCVPKVRRGSTSAGGPRLAECHRREGPPVARGMRCHQAPCTAPRSDVNAAAGLRCEPVLGGTVRLGSRWGPWARALAGRTLTGRTSRSDARRLLRGSRAPSPRDPVSPRPTSHVTAS